MQKNKKPLASEHQRLEKLICENWTGKGPKVTYDGSSGNLESKIPIGMKYVLLSALVSASAEISPRAISCIKINPAVMTRHSLMLKSVRR